LLMRQAIGLHVAQYRDREQSRRPQGAIGLLELAGKARACCDISDAPVTGADFSPWVIGNVVRSPAAIAAGRGLLERSCCA
jgi:hypothetical protein